MKPPSEDQEQIRLFNWIYLKEKEDPRYKMIMHVPNQGSAGFGGMLRSKKMKAMGARKGWFDIFVCLPKGPFHGLFIELKALKGRPSKEQIDWQKMYEQHGYCAVFCYGGREALEKIQAWLTTETIAEQNT